MESFIVGTCILLCVYCGNSYHKRIMKPHSKRFPPSIPHLIVGEEIIAHFIAVIRRNELIHRVIFQLNEAYSFKSKGVLNFYKACIIYFLAFLGGYCSGFTLMTRDHYYQHYIEWMNTRQQSTDEETRGGDFPDHCTF